MGNTSAYSDITFDSVVRSCSGKDRLTGRGILQLVKDPQNPDTGEGGYRIHLPGDGDGHINILVVGLCPVLDEVWRAHDLDKQTVYIAFSGVCGEFGAEYQTDPSRDPLGTITDVVVHCAEYLDIAPRSRRAIKDSK